MSADDLGRFCLRAPGWCLAVCLVGATHALAGEAGQWSSGQEVYTKVCAYCHETGVGPDIHRRGAPPEYARVVRNGRGAMPAFRRTEIDDESLAKLMTFIR